MRGGIGNRSLFNGKIRVFKGKYHVLQGKLSPIRGIGPEQLNFSKLSDRLDSPELKEIILALGNDMEGEATCHYLKEEIIGEREIQVSRIGFGLPSGAESLTRMNLL